MSAAGAIKLLATELAKLGIPASRVELVMPEADVEAIRNSLGKPSLTPTRASVQKIAGILVSGIDTPGDHSHMKMGDLIG